MTGQLSATCRAILATALCAVSLAYASSAAAAPDSLRDGLFRKGPSAGRQLTIPPVARYISEDGQVFTLDRTQARPLLRFDGSSEVWVLSPQPAPRGDVIFKNDVGDSVLRATRLGGVTLFTDSRPEGAAAAPAGPSPPIKVAPLGPQALVERLALGSARSSRAARHLISFESEASPVSATVMGDTIIVATVAITRMSERPGGRGRLAGLKRVFMEEGRKVAAQLKEGTLRITVVPGLGLAGRPSSEKIERVIAQGGR